MEQLDEQELARVAMFPLPNVVLLPGTLLPLHIFEARYRDMIKDVLDTSGLLVMGRLEPGYEAEYHNRPAVFPTVGVGRVVAAEELDDGDYNILVRGLIRATLAEELAPDHSYREVRVAPLSDRTSAEPAVLQGTQQKLLELCEELAAHIEDGGEDFLEMVRSAPTPGQFVDLVCSVFVTDLDERQRLLETRDPLARIELAIRNLNRLLTNLNGRSKSLN